MAFVRHFRCEFTVGKKVKGLRTVHWKDGGKLAGYIGELWGKDAGWFWRAAYNGAWSELPEKTMKAAVIKMGEVV